MFGLFKEKVKSIPVDKYFELTKPKYVYIKITPDKSIRNYNSSNIAKAIAHTYKSIDRRIIKEQKKIFFETNFKISYIIDIYSNNAEFYFMVPKTFVSSILEKIREIWSKATLEILDEGFKPFSDTAIAYQLSYRKEDALSLNIDKKSNEPLNSILSTMEIMKSDDRVTLIYNFLPRNQFGWLKQYNDTIDKIKCHKPIEREKTSVAFIAKAILSGTVSILDSICEVLNDFFGNTKKEKNISLLEAVATVLEQDKELSGSTKKKKELNVVDTQIAIVSSSLDKTRREDNALSVCHAFRTIDEDNELVCKKIKDVPTLNDYRFKGVEINTVSTDEVQNFVQVPGRTLLKEFGIEHVKVNENPVPKELQSGFFNLGDVKIKGNKIESYLEDEYNVGNLPMVLIGSQGSGKTTYIQNIAKYCSDNKEGVFLIDFIKNCELSNVVAEAVDKDRLIIINLANESDIQGLGFNEISIDDSMTAYQKLNLANLQSQQVMALVDSISIGDPLTSRMRRFLNSACNVVFSQSNASIKNVIDCLEDYKKRDDYINGLSDDLILFLEDDIRSLRELDEYSKVTKDNPTPQLIGTKESKIEHILDRVSMLREDFKLKYMYNKSTTDNINLVECMEQGKVVIIQMKESDFPTKMAKNILVTYWFSKVWLSCQLRGALHEQPLRCNVIADEIFQAPTCMKTLEYILPQSRKFGCKFIFSTQYIRQLESIFDTLEASGSSYMLLKGSKEDDFEHFKSKFENYEYEDLRDMEKFHSLNLIYYSGGYASFISKLPKPIKKGEGPPLLLKCS